MANNNEKESYANSLKASFCRQQFPFLLQFLKHFDLSDIHSGHDYSLNMDFLLQSYSHLDGSPENISHRKETCCWILKDVNKEDVLLAIDEYFDITDKNDYLAEQRNKLLFNVVRSKREIQYSFDDNTTLSILNYFNIIKPEKIKELEKRKKGEKLKVDIGKQKGFFSDFIACPSEIPQNKDYNNVSKYDNEVGEKIPEYSFVNAFHLLGSLRNWGSHDIENYSNGETHLFYRYIIYTHIGIIYMCRRFWNKHKDTLIENGYVWPEIMDNCNLKEDVIKVIVKGVNEGQLITSCNYIIGKGDPIPVNFQPARKIEFDISIKKFTSIIVNVICNGENYNIEKYISYYGWNKLFIEIEPPERVHGHFDGIAGDDKEIETLISKLFSDFEEKNKKAGEDMVEKIASFWDKIEPVLQQQRDFIGKELSEKEKKLKEELHNSFKLLIGKLQKDNAAVMKGFANLDKNMQGTNRALEEIDKHNKKLELVAFVQKHFVAFVFLIISIGAFVISYRNDLSISFIQQSWWMIIIEIIALLVVLASFLCIWSSHKTTTQPRLLRPAYKFAGWSLAGLTTLFFILAYLVIPIKTPKGLVENFDYLAKHESGDIAKAAKIMEDYYADNPDDERVRIQLATYYLKNTGEIDKALAVSEPMFKDVKKYPNGVWAYAEVLYEKRDFVGVWAILKDYNDKSFAAECLEGTLLSWGEGCTKDVHKGFKKLIDSFKKGSKEAQYQIGRFLINDMTDWESPNQTIDIAGMDIIRGVYYLRDIASQRPQAALELGKLYSDLNMNDSAIIYIEKAIKMAEDSLLKNDAKYQMGLLAERIKIDSLKHYMTEAKLARYSPALIHSAISENDHKMIIDIYDAAGAYKGHRYIPPIVFEYIATNQLEKAVQTLCIAHPKCMFDMDFVSGMAKIIGSDYIIKDSVAGKELISNSAKKGCKFAQMIVLFTQLQQMLEEGKEIPSSKINELELFGERDSISFAYVLAANLMNRECHYDKAYHLAMKALSIGHPAGVFELRDDDDQNPQWQEYLHSLKENRQKNLWYFRTKQIALRHSLGKLKQRNITAGYLTDVILQNNNLQDWRLSFWSDVIIANPIPGMSFLPLNVWMTGEKNSQSDFYKRQLIVSAIKEHEGAFSEDERNLIVATLNDLADDSFRKTLIKKFGNNHELRDILTSNDDRGFNPHKEHNYTITDGIMSLGHYSIEVILSELSKVIGTDYFIDPFLEN